MKAWSAAALVWMGVVLGACGSDDGQSVCDEAFDKWCACPQVTCDGHPESCTGPDREWAECVLAAEDTCMAECL